MTTKLTAEKMNALELGIKVQEVPGESMVLIHGPMALALIAAARKLESLTKALEVLGGDEERVAQWEPEKGPTK